MNHWKQIGMLEPCSAAQIPTSRLGIGFEKLDRNVFDPEKAYDKLARVGVKWVRLQSGWQRTERQKGVYDFAWLDSVVDNLIRRGMTPWICLCYGNDLYNEEAKQYFGAVGIPPIFTEEQKTGWVNYVSALTAHMKGRIRHYEVWNEPDNKSCWKHGVNAAELGYFTAATAKAVKAADPDAYVIGFALCRDPMFLNEALQTGVGDWIDAVSFHAYVKEEADLLGRYTALRAVCDLWRPELELIQGESGTQSRSDGNGALHDGNWTPRRQAKYLLRHLVTDLSCDVKFTSYFSCMDMIEALRGLTDDKSSYLDYGYFGILGADFDENGFATGEYTPKPSYYALQNLAALIKDAGTPCRFPAAVHPQPQVRSWLTPDLRAGEMTLAGFRLPENALALAYWKPSDVTTEEYEGTVSFQVMTVPGTLLHLIDPLTGEIFAFDETAMEIGAAGNILLRHIPVTDYPLFLIAGQLPAWKEKK